MQEIHLPKKCKAIQPSEQYWKLDKFSYYGSMIRAAVSLLSSLT